MHRATNLFKLSHLRACERKPGENERRIERERGRERERVNCELPSCHVAPNLGQRNWI